VPRRLLRLEVRERRLLAQAAFWLVTFRLGLLLLPFRVVRRLATPAVGTSPSAGAAPERLSWAVAAVANRLPSTTCLPRALALNAMLRRAGFASELQIGVAREVLDALRAHAWVTCQGQAFGRSVSAYAALVCNR
jgi:hypothetical protein